MAREHARILCRIWDDPDFRVCSPEAQRLYLLLLSQPALNLAGVAGLTLRRWARCCEATDTADIEKALADLEDHRFVLVDEDTEELLIRSFIRNDGVASQPYMMKAALRCAVQVVSPRLRRALHAELLRVDVSGLRVRKDDSPVQPLYEQTLQALSDTLSESLSDTVSTPSPGHPLDRVSDTCPTGAGEGEGEGESVPVGNSSPLSDTETVPDKESPRRLEVHRDDVDELCTRLRDRMADNGNTGVITNEWRRQARLLLDRDRCDLGQALKLIDWCQADPFWHANVLCMPTFRKQYRKLLAKAKAEHRSSQGRTPRGAGPDGLVRDPGTGRVMDR